MSRFRSIGIQYMDSNGDPLNGGKLTQGMVKALFHYDPDTGAVTRRVPTLRAAAGEEIRTKHNCGYLQVNIMGRPELLHRLAWLYVHGKYPDNIDHINHDRSDNRLSNLREVTKSENLRNQSLRSSNKTGIPGVGWCKSREKWKSNIGVDGEHINLGRHKDFFEACCARKSAEVKHGFHANHGRAV